MIFYDVIYKYRHTCKVGEGANSPCVCWGGGGLGSEKINRGVLLGIVCVIMYNILCKNFGFADK